MLWLLILHISALLSWCAALLYQPLLLASIACKQHPENVKIDTKIPRSLFTLFLTPAALIAIFSGTLLFLALKTVTLWLMLKLALVCALVGCHAVNGLLIMKLERNQSFHFRSSCYLLMGITLAFITAIIWLVLAKPLISWSYL